jgi:hypothetical protein
MAAPSRGLQAGDNREARKRAAIVSGATTA